MFAGRVAIWLRPRLRSCSFSSSITCSGKLDSWLFERFRLVSALRLASSVGTGLVRAWPERSRPATLLFLMVTPCHLSMRCWLPACLPLPHVAIADLSGSVVRAAQLSRISSSLSQSLTSSVFAEGFATLSRQIWPQVLFSVAALSKRLFCVLIAGRLLRPLGRPPRLIERFL